MFLRLVCGNCFTRSTTLEKKRAYNLLLQAKRKWEKELDVVNILRQLQKSKLLSASMLNKQ